MRFAMMVAAWTRRRADLDRPSGSIGLNGLGVLAAQVGDERMPIGGPLDEDGSRPIDFAEVAKVIAQVGKIGLFAKLVKKIIAVASQGTTPE